MKKGKLIVFEGVSGTGKETQAKLLQKYLAAKKIISHIVFHPTPELKPKLRKAKTPQEQCELLAADRRDVVQQVILPSLTRGEWVMSLRNYVSAYVYQGNGKDVESVDIQPDILFLFDIDPVISMKRILSRGEILGIYETPALLKKKRKKYHDVVKHIPHVMINASLSIDDIHRDVLKYIL